MKKLPEKIDSKFRFVLLAATRAEQMMRGALPKEEEPDKAKNTRLAMTEVIEDQVQWDYGMAPEPVEEPAEEAASADAAGEAAEAES